MSQSPERQSRIPGTGNAAARDKECNKEKVDQLHHVEVVFPVVSANRESLRVRCENVERGCVH